MGGGREGGREELHRQIIASDCKVFFLPLNMKCSFFPHPPSLPCQSTTHIYDESTCSVRCVCERECMCVHSCVCERECVFVC